VKERLYETERAISSIGVGADVRFRGAPWCGTVARDRRDPHDRLAIGLNAAVFFDLRRVALRRRSCRAGTRPGLYQDVRGGPGRDVLGSPTDSPTLTISHIVEQSARYRAWPRICRNFLALINQSAEVARAQLHLPALLDAGQSFAGRGSPRGSARPMVMAPSRCLSYETWQHQYASSPPCWAPSSGDRVPLTIVGVAPQGLSWSRTGAARPLGAATMHWRLSGQPASARVVARQDELACDSGRLADHATVAHVRAQAGALRASR